MKNNNFIKIAGITAAAVVFFSCGGEQQPAAPEEQGTAAATGLITLTPEQAQYAKIQIGSIQEVDISGAVACAGRVEVPPQNRISVHSPVAGFVQTVKYLPGDYVAKGALLAVLRHPDFAARQRELLDAQNSLDLLKLDAERKRALAASEAAGQKALQEAESALRAGQIRFNALRAELALAGFRVDELLKNGEIQTDVSIHAPAAGHIINMNLNQGKLVQPNDLLYEIVDKSHLHFELQVFAQDVAAIRAGDKIEVQLPGSERRYDGEVHLLGHLIDETARTAMVHGHLLDDRKGHELTPGTPIQAVIHTNKSKALALPRAAGVRQDDAWVFYVERENGYEKVALETGRVSEEWIELLQVPEALRPARFVVNGAYYLEREME